MAADQIRTLKTDGRWIAIVVSLGFHGIVIYALASEPWFGFDQRRPIRANLVFVSAPGPRPLLPPEDLPVPEPATELPAPSAESLPVSDIARRQIPAQGPAPAIEPTHAAADTADLPETEAQTQESTAAEPSDRAIAERESRDEGQVAPDRRPVDYDELGRRAVRAYLDRIDSGRQPRSFGGDDRADAGLSSGGGSPRSVFESGPNSRAALRPTKARSRFVRRIATICNELTGGLSLFGLIGLCTDGNVRSDLLAEVKPGYLDEVPQCEEVQLTAAGQAIVAIGEFGATAAVTDSGESGAASAIKCRLVSSDEIYDTRITPAGRN